VVVSDLRRRRSRANMRGLLATAAAFALLFAVLSLGFGPWRAVAYITAGLFGMLFALAFYFWGTMLFGGVLQALRRRTPVPWVLDDAADAVPAHDIDPGLEVMAAGMLVYRSGEANPHVCFRQVPVVDIEALRPFVAVRTGVPRRCAFAIALHDEHDQIRHEDSFMVGLSDRAALVAPPYRLALADPARLAGQHWSLQVKSGVTVVAAWRFHFVNGSSQPESALDWEAHWLPRLVDEAIEQDSQPQTGDIALEEG
jgi:hypothetical protein